MRVGRTSVRAITSTAFASRYRARSSVSRTVGTSASGRRPSRPSVGTVTDSPVRVTVSVQSNAARRTSISPFGQTLRSSASTALFTNPSARCA